MPQRKIDKAKIKLVWHILSWVQKKISDPMRTLPSPLPALLGVETSYYSRRVEDNRITTHKKTLSDLSTDEVSGIMVIKLQLHEMIHTASKKITYHEVQMMPLRLQIPSI